jgi:cob(I)alamin adenosyltransferase
VSTDAMIVLSVLEPALLVIILAIALTRVRQRLTTISNGLGDLGGMLATVESQHLRPLGKLVDDINGPLNTIHSTLPGIAKKAALVVRMAGRR